MTTNVPLLKMFVLFSVLLIVGACATLPLFNFKLKKFLASSLFIKIAYWIPIFLVFVASLYVGNTGRLLIVIWLAIRAFREVVVVRATNKKHPSSVWLFYTLFCFALLHFYFLGRSFHGIVTKILIVLCFSSVLSDVFAFFFGNYLGRHKLPLLFNNRKSWEGVLGQVVGALVGVLLVRYFIVRVSSVWIFLPIGIGSAAGDLYNSYIKRNMNIKDWGHGIPGHGGFLDRLSSLSVAAFLTFYFLKI